MTQEQKDALQEVLMVAQEQFPERIHVIVDLVMRYLDRLDVPVMIEADIQNNSITLRF